ncbi:DUF924 family protein [Thiofilum flexile]|uniref:DUF924 family protein n=1 Tax=Thiofilum flexile TaxID=125627 RepID=UPI000DA134CF|nr:DUF924 family protein [Thiofilum flexile]
MTMTTTPQTIIHFWYTPPLSEHWFNSTPEIDALIRAHYEEVWQQAAAGQLDSWRDTPEGCLALCIILDQFPLNMFRGQAKSFATEQQAVQVTKHALAQQFDEQLTAEQRIFLYMPLMHSEHLADQALSVQCFARTGLDGNLHFAKHHQAIVERFGRFPHRNAILGRTNTPAELDYLNSPEAFKG